jgi:hypothetical protein
MSERFQLTPDQAIRALADQPHSVRNPAPGMLIGCDHDRDDAEEILRTATTIEIAGPAARSTGHGLAVIGADGVRFLSHKEEVLEELDNELTKGIAQ